MDPNVHFSVNAPRARGGRAKKYATKTPRGDTHRRANTESLFFWVYLFGFVLARFIFWKSVNEVRQHVVFVSPTCNMYRAYQVFLRGCVWVRYDLSDMYVSVMQQSVEDVRYNMCVHIS